MALADDLPAAVRAQPVASHPALDDGQYEIRNRHSSLPSGLVSGLWGALSDPLQCAIARARDRPRSAQRPFDLSEVPLTNGPLVERIMCGDAHPERTIKDPKPSCRSAKITQPLCRLPSRSRRTSTSALLRSNDAAHPKIGDCLRAIPQACQDLSSVLAHLRRRLRHRQATSYLKGVLQDRIEADLFKIQKHPALVRSSFKAPDVAYSSDG